MDELSKEVETDTVISIQTWTYQIGTLIEYAKDRKVLEIGAWKGHAAVAMAEVAKEVWCIDNFINHWTNEPDIEKQFRENIQKYGVSDKIKLWVGESNNILSDFNIWNCGFDFIVIDGGHEYPVVNQDSEWACKLCNKDAFIAWHDKNYPPVAAAIEEVRSKYKLIDEKIDGDLLVLKYRG